MGGDIPAQAGLSRPMPIVFLALFSGVLALSFGAGLYEHRITLSRWLRDGKWDAEEARRDDVGRRFWGMVSTGPLTLLSLANLYFALHASGEAACWWLWAAGLALVERTFTFAYFIPTMVGLMKPGPGEVAVRKAQRWRSLNLLRHGLVLAAWAASMRAFALLGPR